MAAFFADRAVPGVESVSGRVYRRTISLDGAPGVLEIHPGGADHLLLRAHLPYWEGLIHVAERAGRMVGADVGSAGRIPGAWGPFEAAVQAIVAQECDDPGEARRQLGRLVRQFGPCVPGLTHGLTHLFPSAEVLAAGDLGDLDLPPATVKSLAALAAGVASGEIVLDHSVRRADLMASLTAVPGIQLATADQIALRLATESPHAASRPTQGRASADIMSSSTEHPVLHPTGRVRSGEQPAQTGGSARGYQEPRSVGDP
jgi:AraC family transcriptional regulator, regulatory protein of adaptative response / DNA-3-methyladenine glycosylase II